MKSKRKVDIDENKNAKYIKSYKKNIKFLETHYWQSLLLLTILGFLLRFFILGFPSSCFYLPDHMNTWAWWRHSVENGLLERYCYNRPKYEFTYGHQIIKIDRPVEGPDGKIYKPGDVLEIPERHWESIPINYPPLNAYVRHIFGLAHRAIDPEMEPLTPAAWVILELPTYIADWFLALGCMFIVWNFKDLYWGFFAFISMWFSLIFIGTGVFWGQCDSWFLAPAIWCVYFCMKEKWIFAGLLWGISLMFKAQALIMVPAFLYFFAVNKYIRGFIIYTFSTLLTMLIISLPFMFKSGIAWFDNSFIYNFTELMPYSTLKAFNIWMIDLLMSKDMSIDAKIIGITKSHWGLILLIIALGLSALVCLRRYGVNKLALPILIAITFAATFLFPTRVHERYIIYFLPFLLVVSFIEQKYWLPFIGFSVIAFFEVTHHIWLGGPLNLSGVQPSMIAFVMLLSISSLVLFIYWIFEMWKIKR